MANSILFNGNVPYQEIMLGVDKAWIEFVLRESVLTSHFQYMLGYTNVVPYCFFKRINKVTCPQGNWSTAC
jgi:hypothetical protein